jgi:hypothetical protein
MSSRGSYAVNGHVTTSEYTTIYVDNAGGKVLKGTSSKSHSLPDFAHTPNSVYVKLKKDGKTLHEMRFYDDKGHPIIEIAYHPEPKINNGNREDSIVHFHLYDSKLGRNYVYRMYEHPDIKEKYAKYLKEYGLYDKC